MRMKRTILPSRSWGTFAHREPDSPDNPAEHDKPDGPPKRDDSEGAEEMEPAEEIEDGYRAYPCTRTWPLKNEIGE